MILRCFHVVYSSLLRSLRHLHVYSSVPRVNRGETGKMRQDTPESWHTVCLIFGGEI